MAELKKIKIGTDESTVLTTDDVNGIIDSRVATDTDLGVVKTDSENGIEVDQDGNLVIGGRFGEYPNGGYYYPLTADPSHVGNYSVLMTDTKGLAVNNRSFIIAGGNPMTLKTQASAGATEYRMKNDYNNRVMCSCLKNGRLTLSIDTAPEFSVPITSVEFANGGEVLPYAGGADNNNDIIIRTAESVNPDSATTTVRGYGYFSGGADIVSVGQLNRATGSKIMQVGINNRCDGTQNAQVGSTLYSNANNSAQFGHTHINQQPYSFLAGQGHDNTNGVQGVSAVGRYSVIDSKTAFVVGNGTSQTARKNAFEVTTSGEVILSSPNGTRYKITVDNNGNLTTTRVV